MRWGGIVSASEGDGLKNTSIVHARTRTRTRARSVAGQGQASHVLPAYLQPQPAIHWGPRRVRLGRPPAVRLGPGAPPATTACTHAARRGLQRALRADTCHSIIRKHDYIKCRIGVSKERPFTDWLWAEATRAVARLHRSLLSPKRQEAAHTSAQTASAVAVSPSSLAACSAV